jgi:hypothetical protein
MQKSEGKPIFDAVSLGEIKISRVGNATTAKFAFVNSKTGHTFGYTDLLGRIFMSRRTQDLMGMLIESLEKDALQVIFPDSSTVEIKEGVANAEPSGIADGQEEGDQV